MRQAQALIGMTAVSAVLALAGCGQKVGEAIVEKALEKSIEADSGNNADVEVSGGSIKISTDAGAVEVTSGASAKLPVDFPADLYVYENAKVLMFGRSPKGFSLSLQTADNLNTVIDQYRAKMIGQGWEEEASVDMGDQGMLAYKKEARTVSIAFTTDSTVTHIVMGGPM